jgi:hypothetical protein
MISYPDLLNILADTKTMQLFSDISSSGHKTCNIMTKFKLTRKQYYSRMSDLQRADLIYRKKGKYFLSTFGKIVYDIQTTAQRKIEYALSNVWKLKAIDSLEIADRISKKEIREITNALIDNLEIKEAIIKEPDSLSSSSSLLSPPPPPPQQQQQPLPSSLSSSNNLIKSQKVV